MTPNGPLRDAVVAAAARDEVALAVQRLYADVQREIDARKPVCAVSGRCCRFEEFGHRLFVTTLELAAFVRRVPAPAAGEAGACPFQRGKLCGVHADRPFGCRIFFCDATSTHWQHEQYESFHHRLKRLHEGLGVVYFYVEWRQALQRLGSS